MADRERGIVRHPAPWGWRGPRLVDRHGDDVISFRLPTDEDVKAASAKGYQPGLQASIHVEDHAAIERTPELLALARRLANLRDGSDLDGAIQEARSLLKAIEERMASHG